MGDFKLITNSEKFNIEARNAWSTIASDDIRNRLAAPMHPELTSFYIINRDQTPLMRSLSCGREEAKRIVYHKTNKNRTNRRMFSWVGENIKKGTQNCVITILQANRMDPDNLEQKAYIQSIARVAKESAGPGLITYRRYFAYPTGMEIIDFFLITMEKARQLVHHNHNIKKIDVKKPKFTNYCDLIIGLNGNVQITLSHAFNTQLDTFRFTSRIEIDLRLWEVAAVRDINNALASLHHNMGVTDKIDIAKDTFDKFYDTRQYRRAEYAIQHPDAWENQSSLAGHDRIAHLLREARIRHHQRGIPRSTE